MRWALWTVSDEYRPQSHGWRNRIASGIALPRGFTGRVDTWCGDECVFSISYSRRNQVPFCRSATGTHRPRHPLGAEIFRKGDVGCTSRNALSLPEWIVDP